MNLLCVLGADISHNVNTNQMIVYLTSFFKKIYKSDLLSAGIGLYDITYNHI